MVVTIDFVPDKCSGIRIATVGGIIFDFESNDGGYISRTMFPVNHKMGRKRTKLSTVIPSLKMSTVGKLRVWDAIECVHF